MKKINEVESIPGYDPIKNTIPGTKYNFFKLSEIEARETKKARLGLLFGLVGGTLSIFEPKIAAVLIVCCVVLINDSLNYRLSLPNLLLQFPEQNDQSQDGFHSKKTI